MTRTVEPADEIAAAIAGDEAALAALTERYRRELDVHCYRMLASFDEAEDAVQETLLRVWHGRDGFEGGSRFRASLYRIATNVCLDVLRRSSRRLTSLHSFAEVPWLEPYADRLLDEMAPDDEQPDAVVVRRETIELASPRSRRSASSCSPRSACRQRSEAPGSPPTPTSRTGGSYRL